MAQYLATPNKGRIGKARNVEPFIVETEGAAGDLDKLARQVSINVGKTAKRRKCFATVELRPDEDFTYHITIWCGDDTVAVLIVETLEG